MRFLGFGASPRKTPSFRLSTSLGEKKINVQVQGGSVRLRSLSGEVLEAYFIQHVAWHTCVLPSKEHCLVLQVPAVGGSEPSSPSAAAGACGCGAPHELLLRSKHCERVEDLQRQLCAASLEAELRQLSLSPSQLSAAVAQVESVAQRQHESGDLRPVPRSLSFGSPMAAEDSGVAVSAEGQLSRSAGQPGPASRPLSAQSSGRVESGGSEEGKQGMHRLLNDQATHPCSAPGSPVLPGLPVVAVGTRASASAPVSPAFTVGRYHETRSAAGQHEQEQSRKQHKQQQQHPSALLPVRLLSFINRSAGRGGAGQHVEHEEGRLQGQRHPPNQHEQRPEQLSHVQLLERAVADLGRELAEMRTASRAASPEREQPKQSQAAVSGGCAQAAMPVKPQLQPASAPSCTAPQTAGTDAACRTGVGAVAQNTASGSSARHVEVLLQENSLLLQQQAALQTELGRMQGRLSAAAADNVRLAQEAAAAVHQMQATSASQAASQQQEAQLRESLAAAVQQCTAVGRELATLSGKLEARTAQCQELRAAVDALSAEKSVLTAALTTAQLQVKEATPACFAAEVTELRRQIEATHAEAATARGAEAKAQCRASEAERHKAEIEGHMREAGRCMADAQVAQKAGLAREEALAAEIRSLRQQLLGQLKDGDPAKGMQERLDKMAASNASLQQERSALAAQVQQLQSVGQELSGSCRALEARMQSAAKEKEGLQAALAREQTASEAAQRQWEQQRQALEASLGAATGRLAGSEDSMASLKVQVQALQVQVEAVQRDGKEAQMQAAVREQQLQGELRLLKAQADAAAQAANDRAEAAAAAVAAEAGRHQEVLRSKEAELVTAQRETAVLAAEQQQLQEDLRRSRDERTAAVRDVQLEASSAKAEAARLAQELHTAKSVAEQAQHAAEEAQRMAQQAQAQAAAAAAAHTALSQERKELQGRVDRLAVDSERAARARDAAELKCSALRQQCKLLEAVARGQAALGRRGGSSKENDGAGGEGIRIRAFRQSGDTLSISSSD